jgi:acyl dehydratase
VSYAARRLPRVGETLAATSGVTERKRVSSPAGELTVTTLRTEYRGADGEVATETVRMIDLPASGKRPAAPEAADAPTADPLLAQWPGISRRQVAWMTVETGDLNPLHVDLTVASRRGFADVVVPAPLLTAQIERELARLFGAHPLRLDVRYQAPTLPGAALALHGRREGAKVGFTLSGQGLTRATGRAALTDEAGT